MSKPKVLFLCTGNAARSQMAEAFLRAYAGDHFDVYSAGLKPREINPLTIRVMAERGFDLAGQRAKGLDEYLGTVCQRAQEECPVFPFVHERLSWPFEDPARAEGSEEVRLDAFRRVRDEIDGRIRHWVQDELHLQIQVPSEPAS